MGNFPHTWHKQNKNQKRHLVFGIKKKLQSIITQCQVESQSTHITVFHTSPRQKMFQETFQQRAGDHYVTGKSIKKASSFEAFPQGQDKSSTEF